ncbi:hypothetical protein ASD83_01860 [Devosia sp. Root685]|uniref:GNAT family N-acetyltransferase n=1 Tax=Devosia sp. Root685 TaxID=1736587 RepID=UPI0006F30830|nr:GNAT family N-acetyltransferase [Devosia sp. Root685]KRA99297.1 hypothetical protein ASD83_01860 [Devosia sp. Root685]
MNLFELDPKDYQRVKNLGAAAGEIHLSVAAVIEGAAEGEIHVDDEEHPTLCVVEGPEGTYLLSEGALSPDAAEALADHLDDWVYLHVAGGEPPQTALPNAYMLRHSRLVFSLPLDASPPQALPSGYAVVQEADDFGHRIYFGEQEVSRCLPDVISGSRAEIGVWTHADHRRRGLASHALGATLRAAGAAGIAHMGWHCHASNAGSIALARSMGAGDPKSTLAYSASLPAENQGDLTEGEWLDLAQHFLAGRDEIGWLGFHAACAFACAGETDLALDAVDRLVDDRWHGSPSWLINNWALAGLVTHPRMLAAVARLERQKAPPV